MFPLQSEVQTSEGDVLGLLDYEDDLSEQKAQVKLWFEEFVKSLARGNLNGPSRKRRLSSGLKNL